MSLPPESINAYFQAERQQRIHRTIVILIVILVIIAIVSIVIYLAVYAKERNIDIDPFDDTR